MARDVARPLRVLDVACGGGDLLVDLAMSDKRRRSPLWALSGCDISEVALDRARDLSRRREASIDWFHFDALSAAAPAGAPYDVVMCSLFLHHLDDDEARRFLTAAAGWSTVGIVVHDLARSTAGLALASLASNLLTRSAVVRYDALRSVEGAFTPDEAVGLARSCGLEGAAVTTRWPARFVLEWRR